MSQLLLTAEALAGTAPVGGTEYNGTIFTKTPMTGQRGIVPAEQFFMLNAGLAGSQVLTAQNILGVGVTLSASTIYEFEAIFTLGKTAGTTSHGIATSFGGTATLNSIMYKADGIWNTTTGALPMPLTAEQVLATNSASATTFVSGVTTANNIFVVTLKGTVSINAGGTFIPQYTLSAAPGGAYTTAAGSYMKIKPIGVAGANVSVGAWA